MAVFEGFPQRARYAPVPTLFFTELLPAIADPGELKVTLYLFFLLFEKKGHPKFVTWRELLGERPLLLAVRRRGEPPEESLRRGLRGAVTRGTVLHVALELTSPERIDHLFLINSEANRRVVARIESGELDLGGKVLIDITLADAEPRPNIFELYEQNIGILTPLLADELREAERLYPPTWVEDAIREAVSLNRRNWRYIARILERWATEGRQSGESGRDLAAYRAERRP